MGSLAARITTPVPPLRDGDRMTPREFLRRYKASPEGLRAELLAGVVSINAYPRADAEDGSVPPISSGGHSFPQSKVHFWLESYALHTPGVEAGAPATLVLATGQTVPEPDALLVVKPGYGGRTVVGADDFLHGSPELLVEVANTTAGTDLGTKRDAYQAGRVKEYVVWRTRAGVIDWFRLNRLGRYVPVPPDAEGVFRSRVFPGLWLHGPSLIERNMPGLLQVVQAGIASSEHAAFVAKLGAVVARRKPKK